MQCSGEQIDDGQAAAGSPGPAGEDRAEMQLRLCLPDPGAPAGASATRRTGHRAPHRLTAGYG